MGWSWLWAIPRPASKAQAEAKDQRVMGRTECHRGGGVRTKRVTDSDKPPAKQPNPIHGSG